ncbi:hypothetical protein AUR64_05990 [Haloprofundus marisrubri]|uniref:Uncharacterized protein n=1 Tax=Haloprofundus marisrubri TaxID=1514971 RepID=A0A0W1RBI0_9EURY|nr:hypothetical protein [Haloprofundus marisrubri]KTG10741.1 hypothetical protein AUR64_05990 [Haloprofundus marisrubri]
MSSDDETPGLMTKAYRTVTPGYTSHPDTEMNVIGLTYALLLVILIVPLLPFMIIVWLLTRVLERAERRRGSDETDAE